MKIFLIILFAILAILLVLFVSWFMIMKVNGKCPLCAMKKIFLPTKLTMDISEDEDYPIGEAATPPMGWSSWNTFRNHIDQDLIMEVANAVKNSGLEAAGYRYINLDDCWQSSMRDADGKLQGDLKTFSRGIPKLIKDINKLGLKVGLYSSNGTLTCEDLPASLGNEDLDAKTLASWGCEYFKYDFCHKQRIHGDCPAIEYVTLNKPETSIDIKLKPEQAKLTGRARVMKMNDVPSKKAIGYLGFGAGTASFDVDIEERGKYVFTAVFHKSFSRHKQYMQVIVNDKIYEIFFPEGNGFSDTGRAQIYIELKQGVNTITLKNPVITLTDSSYIQYRRMGAALKNATSQWAMFTHTQEKPITFSICEWGTAHPWNWGSKAGNLWRTTHDILPNWTSIHLLYNRTIGLYEHAGPGHWNDPDMLEVGNGKLTEIENKTHFSLWCMMASPLMLGNDVRKFVNGIGEPDWSNPALRVVTNKHLIAIDQDTLGKPAKRIKKLGGVDIIARPLANGDVAVCFYNPKMSSKSVHYQLDELAQDKYLNIQRAKEAYELHDLWSDERSNGVSISVNLPKHGCAVYRIKSV